MPRAATRAVTRTRQFQDKDEGEVGQSKPRLQKSTGPARESLEPRQVEPSTRPVDKEWADMMAFNREKVTIRVLPTTEKNALRIIEVWNNGDRMAFPRDEDVTCERRFVESLCRAKRTTYTQRKVKDDQSGVEQYMEVPSTAPEYPFTMVRDDNPRGADWLKSIRSGAA